MADDDRLKAVLWTAGPALASVTGGFVIGTMNKDTVSWWSSMKKPVWAPRNLALYSAVDCATLMSMGYGAYLLQQKGMSADTKMALGAYAVTYLAAHSSWPAIFKKNMNWMCASAAGTTASACVTAALFHRLNACAGHYVMPYCVWMAFYVALTYSMCNDKHKQD